MRLAVLLITLPSASLAQVPEREEPLDPNAPANPDDPEEPADPEDPSQAGSEEEPGSFDPEDEPAVETRVEKKLPTHMFGTGARIRYITVPHFLLQGFLAESTALHSWAFAGEFVWTRVGLFTLMTSLEVASYDAADGNYLGKSEPADEKTDFVQFRGLKMISIDATFLWDHTFTQEIALVWGAGLGLMFPTGSVFRASSEGCTEANAGNESACFPQACRPNGCSTAEVNSLRSVGDPFGDDRGAAFEQDLWPVYPLLNALIGVRYTPHRHFQLRLDTGFHNAFFLGTAAQYLF